MAKNAGQAAMEAVIQKSGAGKGDTIFLMAGPLEATLNFMGALRLELARKENWIPPGLWNMLWVVDFPLLEFAPSENGWG